MKAKSYEHDVEPKEGDHEGDHLLIIFQLVIDQSFKLIEKASQDKEEVFEGGWSGVTTPSTTANKDLCGDDVKLYL